MDRVLLRHIYSYDTDRDQKVIDCSQIPDEEPLPIIRGEVEATVKARNIGKSDGVGNIPA